ncbi:MAG: efflux RND transporter periplasmic adaptor subunit [Gemmatimonadetes bacterium]|nr:efflux RND transporter periplasmic adaptor subunit [Gemmatimonadota bacterium]
MTNSKLTWTSRRARAAAGILGLALASLPGCGGGAEEAAATAPDLILDSGDLAVARDTSMTDAVILTGTLQPYRVTEVRAQVPGTLAALRADRGDAVRAGQTLADLNAAGITSAAEAARVGLAASEAGEALARKQLDSARRLYERGALSAIELQSAQAGYDAAAGQLAGARAQLAAAAEAAGHVLVAAPFDGRVSTRDVNLGEAVNPGQTLFTVVDARILELAGEVTVQTAARLRPGARVTFAVDGYPDEQFAGEVARVEPVADEATRRVGVYLRVPNQSGRLLGGVFATGRVDVGAAQTGVTVPASAVRGSGDSLYVWLVQAGAPARRVVTVLQRDDAAALVQLRGVSAGDTVIVSPGNVTEGTRLQIAKQPASAGGQP